VVGTFLIVAAVYLLSLPSGRVVNAPSVEGSPRLGVALALLAGVLWAFSTILMKSGVGHTDLVVVSSVRLPAAGLVLLAPVLRQGGGLRVRGIGGGTLALLVVSGIIGSGLSSFLYVAGVMYAGAAKATALQAVSPFVAAPLARIFLKERIAPATLAGTALSVLGAWLVLGL
jgi:drug/metabolite transporter (DMT)-like permease